MAKWTRWASNPHLRKSDDPGIAKAKIVVRGIALIHPIVWLREITDGVRVEITLRSEALTPHNVATAFKEVTTKLDQGDAKL